MKKNRILGIGLMFILVFCMMSNFVRVDAYDAVAPDLSHICNSKGGTVNSPNPTCTSAGYAYYTCSECGKISAGKGSVAALGHNWSDATCTTAKTCSRCKDTSGKALGHDWDFVSYASPAPTCIHQVKPTKRVQDVVTQEQHGIQQIKIFMMKLHLRKLQHVQKMDTKW